MGALGTGVLAVAEGAEMWTAWALEGGWAVAVKKNNPDPGTPLAHACLLPQDLPATIPKLDTPDLLEVGTQQKLFCSLEGLFSS